MTIKNDRSNRSLNFIFDKSASYFKNKIIEANNKFNFNKPVILFGAAKMGKQILEQCNSSNIQVAGFCDNDHTKFGQSINNVPIISPTTLLEFDPKTTQIIISCLHDNTVKKQLNKMGYHRVWSYTYFLTIFPKRFSSLAWTNNINNIFINKRRIYKAFHFLTDNTSKNTFINILKYRLTLDRKYLKKIQVKNQVAYFDRSIITLSNKEVFLDGGAYDGDTLIPFIKFTNNEFLQAYCFEPDTKSYVKLVKLANNTLKDHRVKCIPYGLGRDEELVYFSDDGGLGSKILYSGPTEIRIAKIDDYIKAKFTFVKLDIEGFEKQALQGAKQTIKTYQPKLAVCSYHYQEDLWKIPLLIKKLNPQYKLYLRHYDQYVFDTIYYGV